MTVNYRWADSADYDVLGEVIFDAVRNGPSLYNEAQRRAWVEEPRSGPEWHRHLVEQSIAIAENEATIVGLMSLKQDGYLDLAFIRPAFQGTGIFRILYAMIFKLALSQGHSKILVHASLMAQPAFSAMGFEIVKKETVDVDGQCLDRFEMQWLMQNPA
ncbi:MAG: GNAT family N-acetyltransferase [Sphingorhabdus sp.]|uniref:GNAT family N-acetyltransferase n=1 Tax=Sphingorhabdus sp. TaxID=1902408 RepID=UPI0038FCB3D0